MVSFRDSDYAHELTDTEQQTLDALLGRIGKPDRRRYLAPAAAAAAVLGVLGFVALRPGPAPAPRPGPGPLTAPLAPRAVIGSLAEAAGRVPAAKGAYLYRSDLAVVVTGAPAACVITAWSAQTWTAAASPANPVAGRLKAELIDPPAGAAAAAGCAAGARNAAGARTLFDGSTADAAASWAQAARAGAPAYPTPRAISVTFNLGGRLPATPAKLDQSLGKLCVNAGGSDCAGRRWNALTGILTSPEATPADRALALRTAAGIAGTTVLPTGVTLRVPAVAGSADLTFDPATGDLIQRTERSADGSRVEITYFRAHTRTPGAT